MNFFIQMFTLPLDNDYSWIQVLTGIHWLIASIMAFTIKWQRNWFWLIFSAFLFYCSLDEMFMIHECVKYSSHLWNSNIKDYLILIYGIGALFGAIYFYYFYIKTKNQRILLVLMLLLVILIVLNDVFDLSLFVLQNAAEECCELILSALIIIFIQTFPTKQQRSNRYISAFLLTIFIVLGLYFRLYLWLKVCPAVLKF